MVSDLMTFLGHFIFLCILSDRSKVVKIVDVYTLLKLGKSSIPCIFSMVKCKILVKFCEKLESVTPVLQCQHIRCMFNHQYEKQNALL
jgi:hypothetical protein